MVGTYTETVDQAGAQSQPHYVTMGYGTVLIAWAMKLWNSLG